MTEWVIWAIVAVGALKIVYLLAWPGDAGLSPTSGFATQPWRPQRYIYTRYDLTFPYDLSLDTMEALRSNNIKHDEVVLPCGHYTLGNKPWVWIDGWKIVNFLRKRLK